MLETGDTFTNLSEHSTAIVWIGFLLLLLIYGIFSAILVYHWRKYAIGADIIRKTLLYYFISTGTLFLIGFITLFFI